MPTWIRSLLDGSVRHDLVLGITADTRIRQVFYYVREQEKKERKEFDPGATIHSSGRPAFLLGKRELAVWAGIIEAQESKTKRQVLRSLVSAMFSTTSRMELKRGGQKAIKGGVALA